MDEEREPASPQEIYTSIVELLREVAGHMEKAPPEPDLKILLHLNQALRDLSTAVTSLTSYILEEKLEG